MGTENTALAAQPERLNRRAERFIKRPGHCAGGRITEGRTAATTDITVERELADTKDGPAGGPDVEVHPPVRVLENPELGNLPGHRDGGVGCVVVPDAEEDEETWRDAPSDAAIDADRSAGDPLDERTHADGLARRCCRC